MPLVPIAPPDYDVVLDLRYATPDNVTGAPIYGRAAAYLHEEAAGLLRRAIELARPLGYRFKLFDAFRPTEAQWRLWHCYPSDEFVADPRRGSPHSRGAAVDLTLIDAAGRELEMGTGFDAFTPQAHHARTDIPEVAQRNRAVLLGIMTAAGWDNFRNEWWHYQLFNARRLPLISDKALPEPMMARAAVTSV
ncbi:D-alanyl-D-alanine dipeptidase [Ferruginivarius sediminum]|uniref:D-alanyl-D-alanine dipeptidase n=1 Tax=Ferruginivarius sediminum TaxID=2661937 RepID=A0A369TL08_9PROT|nr:D-alanyl-D-alanine dipeptidase [Ferruginivarius sediminum]RDD63586.1 D-alanyl-D-alanine dipeptidase [Ferruginivarius sediminum]